MIYLINNLYEKIYGAYPKISIKELPIIQELESHLIHRFLWDHIKCIRSCGKEIPLRPRKDLKSEQYAKLKRELETLIYHARYALAFLEKL